MSLIEEFAEAAADFVTEVYEGVRRGSQKVMARQQEPKCSTATFGTTNRCDKTPARPYKFTNGLTLHLCAECAKSAKKQ